MILGPNFGMLWITRASGHIRVTYALVMPYNSLGDMRLVNGRIQYFVTNSRFKAGSFL